MSTKPYVLEGLFPAWMLQKLWERTPNAPDGYRTRLSVVQANESRPSTASRARISAPSSPTIASSSSSAPMQARRFAESLHTRLGTRAGGPAIALATVRTRATPQVAQTLQQFAVDQHEEHQRLLAEIQRIYAGRDLEWWRRRYAQKDETLRALVPTCRYSTFVKHSAADLSEAFRTAGWESRVLIEPDDTATSPPSPTCARSRRSAPT